MTSSSNNTNEFVVIRNLAKSFGGFHALNDVSFDIKEGEIFGYIGPNGAGKTTTMKILVGLITDFQGEVSIGGYQVPKRKDEIHKLLGYLPQSVAFQEWRTVNQALITFGKLSGLSDQKVKERIPEVLGLLGLAEAQNKKVSQLSGGMMQKVGLAQALLHEPKFLVLDEPLSGLDPLSRFQFKEIVLKLCQKRNNYLVFFTYPKRRARCRRQNRHHQPRKNQASWHTQRSKIPTCISKNSSGVAFVCQRQVAGIRSNQKREER